MKSKNAAPTFYEKLTSRRHIGLDGQETFSTHPGMHGAIICRRPGMPDQRVFLLSDEKTGRITILNMETREERKTFRIVQNCCAEEFYMDIDLITRPKSNIETK